MNLFFKNYLSEVQIPVPRPWVIHLKENKENWNAELNQLDDGKKDSTEGEKSGEDSKNDKAERGENKEEISVDTTDHPTEDLDNIDFIDNDEEGESVTTH